MHRRMEDQEAAADSWKGSMMETGNHGHQRWKRICGHTALWNSSRKSWSSSGLLPSLRSVAAGTGRVRQRRNLGSDGRQLAELPCWTHKWQRPFLIISLCLPVVTLWGASRFTKKQKHLCLFAMFSHPSKDTL